ncbi:Cyanovirin-N [Dendrothele bispora CBS 962.96]|uniref:Cyanovirin-N n=1 Tax=Dendrothele bispora (strain CBS 962.96) TaxID=1314807 RepID=A0A4S8LRZ8_DENBC|nr:Cyanovirin-N [Dendrothele bispora CBS 962.96]
MPFDPKTCHDPRLERYHLVIDCQCPDATFRCSRVDLDKVLGVAYGRFKWGGYGFSSHAQEIILTGSELSAELRNGDDRWISQTIDLSSHIRNNNGSLETFGIVMHNFDDDLLPAYPKGSNPFEAGLTKPSKFSSYPKDSGSSQMSTIGSSNSSSSSSRLSYHFKETVPKDRLRLQGSVLHADCRKADGSFASSTIDLDEYIGVVSGKLVWGRKGFRSECTNIRLEEDTIKVECRDEETHSSVTADLDLSRYLQAYDGILGVKVTEASEAELSDLLSEARWMKLKVVAEPDASTVIKNPAFKDAFSSLAELTSRHVVTELSEDLVESVGMEIKEAMEAKIKAQVTEVVAEALSEQVFSEMERKVEETFALAKRVVIEACNQVVDAAINNVTIQCTESIIGPMTDEILAKCDAAVSSTVKEVTDTAISHFQERVEILMEREIASAALRRSVAADRAGPGPSKISRSLTRTSRAGPKNFWPWTSRFGQVQGRSGAALAQ